MAVSKQMPTLPAFDIFAIPDIVLTRCTNSMFKSVMASIAIHNIKKQNIQVFFLQKILD